MSSVSRRLLRCIGSLYIILLATGTALASPRQDVEDSLRFAFQARAQALLQGGDEGHPLAEHYDVMYAQGESVVGAKLLSYERNKITEFRRYLAGRKMKVIDHEVELRFERVTISEGMAHATVTESLCFSWVYEHKPDHPNATGLGMHHQVDLVLKNGRWLIQRDEYLDSFKAGFQSDHRTPRS